MSLSDTAILEQYKLARDKLVAAIISDEDIQVVEVRGKHVQKADFVKELEMVEERIRYYTNLSSTSGGGRAKNFARLKK